MQGSDLDLRSVKEQLRLLGHVVADDVIEGFIVGLRKGKEPTVSGHDSDVQQDQQPIQQHVGPRQQPLQTGEQQQQQQQHQHQQRQCDNKQQSCRMLKQHQLQQSQQQWLVQQQQQQHFTAALPAGASTSLNLRTPMATATTRTAAALPTVNDCDASPSSSKQPTDQTAAFRRLQAAQSSKSTLAQRAAEPAAAASRALGEENDSDSDGDSEDSLPMRHAALDARCRSFLAKLRVLSAQVEISAAAAETGAVQHTAELEYDSSEDEPDGSRETGGGSRETVDQLAQWRFRDGQLPMLQTREQPPRKQQQRQALLHASSHTDDLRSGTAGSAGSSATDFAAAVEEEDSVEMGIGQEPDYRSLASSWRPDAAAQPAECQQGHGRRGGCEYGGSGHDGQCDEEGGQGDFEKGADAQQQQQQFGFPSWYQPIGHHTGRVATAGQRAVQAEGQQQTVVGSAAGLAGRRQTGVLAARASLAGQSPTGSAGSKGAIWGCSPARVLGTMHLEEASIIGGTGAGSTGAGHPHHSRCEDPLFRAPSSPTPSSASGPAMRAPPPSPLSPVPPLRRSSSGGAGAGPGPAHVLRPSLRPASAGPGASGPRRLQQPPQQQQQQRQQQRATTAAAAAPVDKYERLSLMEAGWDPAAAATACKARAQAVGSCGEWQSGGQGASSAAVARRSGAVGRSCGGCGGGAAPVGVKKTDRVNRYKELQEQWSRDRFLRSGAAGASTDTTRRPLNFAAYFAAAHADADADHRSAVRGGRTRGQQR